MEFSKKYIVGIYLNGEKAFFKRSVNDNNGADFVYVRSKSKQFDDLFVANAVKDSLYDCGYNSFVDEFYTINI